MDEHEDETGTAQRLPTEFEAERAVLGAMIIDPKIADELMDSVSSTYFFDSRNVLLCEAMKKLSAQGKPIDEILVCDELRDREALADAGGALYIAQVTEACPLPSNAFHYLAMVKNCAQARQAMVIGHDIVRSAALGGRKYREALPSAQAAIAELDAESATSNPMHIKSVMATTYKNLGEKAVQGQALSGLPTGFTDLDQLTSGLDRKDLIVLAGRSGMGKTTLAVNIAEFAALRHNATVLILSMEMRPDQVALRMMSSQSRVSARKIRQASTLNQVDFSNIAGATQALSETQIWMDGQKYLKPSDVRRKMRYVHQKSPLDLVVVDFLQMMGNDGTAGRNDTSERLMSERVLALKNLASEFNVPLIALSQLNRQYAGRADKRPVTSDLRDSGAIEHFADLVMFVYREERDDADSESKGIAEVIVGKQRNGEEGTVELLFSGDHNRFDNLTRRD